ncbi:putative DNA methyltransferase 1-associated protein 1 [Blattamonas nauphoetae]|uniref:DNA methyltransferase 1-associated protein 1 n=1 Tax=Blattamonas nauphoetae TaxID=2049346 RepID=A0ABQ9Y9B3_9EUKA|nr:putative DNA methyltransferase 1-associated protein 1 [Blattamonas nauphoetae]
MTDVKLILGIAEKSEPPSHSSTPVGERKRKTARIPEGMSREVYQLGGMLPQTPEPVLPRQKPKLYDLSSQQKWEWKEIQNPDRTDGQTFSTYSQSNLPASFILPRTYKKPFKVPSYTQQEYDSYLSAPGWTKETTDTMFSLLSTLSFSFAAVSDRIEPEKSIEELKSRFYNVCRILTDNRLKQYSTHHIRSERPPFGSSFEHTHSSLEEASLAPSSSFQSSSSKTRYKPHQYLLPLPSTHVLNVIDQEFGLDPFLVSCGRFVYDDQKIREKNQALRVMCTLTEEEVEEEQQTTTSFKSILNQKNDQNLIQLQDGEQYDLTKLVDTTRLSIELERNLGMKPEELTAFLRHVVRMSGSLESSQTSRVNVYEAVHGFEPILRSCFSTAQMKRKNRPTPEAKKQKAILLPQPEKKKRGRPPDPNKQLAKKIEESESSAGSISSPDHDEKKEDESIERGGNVLFFGRAWTEWDIYKEEQLETWVKKKQQTPSQLHSQPAQPTQATPSTQLPPPSTPKSTSSTIPTPVTSPHTPISPQSPPREMVNVRNLLGMKPGKPQSVRPPPTQTPTRPATSPIKVAQTPGKQTLTIRLNPSMAKPAPTAQKPQHPKFSDYRSELTRRPLWKATELKLYRSADEISQSEAEMKEGRRGRKKLDGEKEEEQASIACMMSDIAPQYRVPLRKAERAIFTSLGLPPSLLYCSDTAFLFSFLNDAISKQVEAQIEYDETDAQLKKYT